MQVVSYIFIPCTKYSKNFQSGKLSNPHTHSSDSPYIEHSNPHFHTEHHLNWLTPEYIKHDYIWLN